MGGRPVPVLTLPGLPPGPKYLLVRLLGDRLRLIHEPIAGDWYWDHTDLSYPLFPPVGHGPNVRCRPLDKLLFSTLRVDDGGDGPTLAKVNLNYSGLPERRARARGLAPGGWPPIGFRERFVPEVEGEFHVSNITYVCFGHFISLRILRLPAETIADIKAAEGELFRPEYGCRTELHAVDAPEVVKARAAQWNLDFGTVDWVSGHVVDINKTPTVSDPGEYQSWLHQFRLHGVDLLAWLRERLEAVLPD